MMWLVIFGVMLLGCLSNAAIIQQVDYEATNYYNGDFDNYDLPTALTDDDVKDDYVTTGARHFQYVIITTISFFLF